MLQLQHMVDLVVPMKLARSCKAMNAELRRSTEHPRKDKEIEALTTGLFREFLTLLVEGAAQHPLRRGLALCPKNISTIAAPFPIFRRLFIT